MRARKTAIKLQQLLRDEVDRLFAEPSKDVVAALTQLRGMKKGILRAMSHVRPDLLCQPIENEISAIAERVLAEAVAAQPRAPLRKLLSGMEDEYMVKLVKDYLGVRQQQYITDVVRAARCRWNTTLTRADDFGHGMDERVIEVPLALEVCDLARPGRVLDAGCALNHGFIRALVDPPVASLVHFTQSGLREEARFSGGMVSYVFGDLRAMPFPDDHFDRIVCISTLEHVGMDNERYGSQAEHAPDSSLQAVRDLMRVLKPGGTVLFTVPYGSPADFGWFRILGPTDIDAIVAAARPAAVEAHYYRLEGAWLSSGADVADMTSATGADSQISGLAALRLVK